MKRNIFFVITICLALLYVEKSQAQSSTIQGVVSDAKTGERLPGVNVFLEKSNIGSSTDNRGKFILSGIAEGKYTLKASFVGFKKFSKQINLKSGKTINLNITLNPTDENLDEVVVTGKSEARELREKAMPISVISMNEIQGTVSDVNEVLVKTTGLKLRNTGGVGSIL